MSKDLEAKFWEDFGFKKPRSIGTATDDRAAEASRAAKTKLFVLSTASGSMTQTEITDRPLKKDMLDTNDVFILNTGQAGVFAWVGKGSDKQEKMEAMKAAQRFVKQEKLPEWTPIARLVEGGETPLFKQNFSVWPEPVSVPGAQVSCGTTMPSPPSPKVAAHRQVRAYRGHSCEFYRHAL